MGNIEIILKHFGTIELGNKVVISDPCYGTLDTDVSVNVSNMCKGMYDVYIGYCRGKFEPNNAFIKLVHTDYRPETAGDHIGFASVDSGTMGIFDEKFHSEYHTENGVDDEWYKKNVVDTLGENMLEKAFICCSGYGDGTYPVFGEMNENRELIMLSIEFIQPNYEDDEEYEILDTISNEEDPDFSLYEE